MSDSSHKIILETLEKLLEKDSLCATMVFFVGKDGMKTYSIGELDIKEAINLLVMLNYSTIQMFNFLLSSGVSEEEILSEIRGDDVDPEDDTIYDIIDRFGHKSINERTNFIKWLSRKNLNLKDEK